MQLSSRWMCFLVEFPQVTEMRPVVLSVSQPAEPEVRSPGASNWLPLNSSMHLVITFSPEISQARFYLDLIQPTALKRNLYSDSFFPVKFVMKLMQIHRLWVHTN